MVVLEFQIDDAIFAEPRYRHAALRVQRDHLVAGRDVDDPFLASIGPVGQTAPGELARCRFAAFAFGDVMHPQQLAGLRVKSDGGPTSARCHVQHTMEHQRRGLQVVFGTWAQRIGPESPRDIEL